MLAVYYQGRALPLAWIVFKGKKGHSSAEMQLNLLKYIKTLLPEGLEVVVLGDGEFDSSTVVSYLKEQENWHYVCRTASNIKVFHEDEWIRLDEFSLDNKCEKLYLDIIFTESGQVVNVNVAALWNYKKERHIFFVSSFSQLSEIKELYAYRFTIETLFSDSALRLPLGDERAGVQSTSNSCIRARAGQPIDFGLCNSVFVRGVFRNRGSGQSVHHPVESLGRQLA